MIRDLPTGTEITSGPHQVEFRLVNSAGVRVVSVWLGGSTPRIQARYIRLEAFGITEHPMSLFLDEVLLYTNAALEQQNSRTRAELSYVEANVCSPNTGEAPAHNPA